MAVLPDEEIKGATKEIVARMNHCTAPPVQVLCNLMNPLLKKACGHGTICALASVYRLSTKSEAAEESA